MTMGDSYWIAVAAILVVSSARLTRLLTWDKFPPVQALRDRFAAWSDRGPRRRAWQLVAFCAYCMSFWTTAALVLWADAAGVFDGETLWGTSGELATPVWFLVNGTLAASYLAAMVVIHDGDNGDESPTQPEGEEA